MKFSLSSFVGSFVVTSALISSCTVTCAKTVQGTILVLARDAASGYSGTSGLNAYGIPYQLVIVPQAGLSALPVLNSTASAGNFGGFIVISEVAYGYSDGTGWHSALTTAQWQSLYDYQTTFSVRMVRLDVYPSSDFGVQTAIDGEGCCAAGIEQLVSFTDLSAIPTANLKTNAGVSTQGLWHYPAKITNTSIATQIASFASGGDFTSNTTAAVINNIGGRQQLVWFTSFATEWSQTSNFLMHAHINWITRGLYVGRRRVYFQTQVDDMQLATTLYSPSNSRFRTRVSDLETHASWSQALTKRLPAGSSYVIELGHNGNGNIQWAINGSATVATTCAPGYVALNAPPATPLEFQKVLGTGTDLWPSNASYNYSLACLQADALGKWFMTATNRDMYTHVSHTFTHELLNNATYSDVTKELKFNQAWLKQSGIANGVFSSSGLIPPAITGLHNGDAIKAFLDNGIKNVVGDNSRPVLRNQVNEYYPLTSNVDNNGYAGLTIVPRWSLPIYFDCSDSDCTTAEWISASGGSGSFTDLLAFTKQASSRALLSLHHDGYMFHQANMRSGDVSSFTVGGQSGTLSLMQIWVETVLQELTRLTTWPVISLKHDDLAQQFKDRQTRDACTPLLTYALDPTSKYILGATLTTASNSCSAPIPITLPSVAIPDLRGSVTMEQRGTDPLTLWLTMTGTARTVTFLKPIAL